MATYSPTLVDALRRRTQQPAQPGQPQPAVQQVRQQVQQATTAGAQPRVGALRTALRQARPQQPLLPPVTRGPSIPGIGSVADVVREGQAAVSPEVAGIRALHAPGGGGARGRAEPRGDRAPALPERPGRVGRRAPVFA